VDPKLFVSDPDLSFQIVLDPDTDPTWLLKILDTTRNTFSSSMPIIWIIFSCFLFLLKNIGVLFKEKVF
jgi:hypothetical protein